jgi:hypothetical protein
MKIETPYERPLNPIVGSYQLPTDIHFQPDANLIERMGKRQPCIESGIEFRCTEEGMSRHIVRIHFDPFQITKTGVSRYDAEVALFRGFKLREVVDKAYERLERPDHEIMEEIQRRVPGAGIIPGHNFSVTDYGIAIVKNLQLLAILGLASIDIQRLEEAFPGASSVGLNIANDTKDDIFLI